MKRREINIELADGKEYTFSERNKEDSDFSALQDRIRKHKIKFIQENVTDPENQSVLMMQQINKFYDAQEVGSYLAGNKEEISRMCYDSFKIKNDLSYDQFLKLVEGKITTVYKLLNELEKEEPLTVEEAAKEIRIKPETIKKWKDEFPQLYNEAIYLKKNKRKK